jgi:hypothetical protein
VSRPRSSKAYARRRMKSILEPRKGRAATMSMSDIVFNREPERGILWMR